MILFSFICGIIGTLTYSALYNQIGSPAKVLLFLPALMFLVCLAIRLYLGVRRKTRITETVSFWNRLNGLPAGFYFALGSTQGQSAEHFWIGMSSRVLRVGRGSLVLLCKPMIHLYVNPAARRDWCQTRGRDLDLPAQPQHQPHQHQYPAQYPPTSPPASPQ